jgi:hypothetical protein
MFRDRNHKITQTTTLLPPKKTISNNSFFSNIFQGFNFSTDIQLIKKIEQHEIIDSTNSTLDKCLK